MESFKEQRIPLSRPIQAITTKLLPQTNTKGLRIKATNGDESVTIDYPIDAEAWEAHELAASMLAEKLDWIGDWSSGWLPLPNSGMAFVFTSLRRR